MFSTRLILARLPRALLLLLTLMCTWACGANGTRTNDAGHTDAGGADASSVPTLRVLFVGNSYTKANDLPAVVARLSDAEQSPVRFEVGMHAPGGQTWEGHDKDPALDERLAEGWDYVVLQDQSQQAFSVRGVKPALLSLDTKVRASGAQTILYMTWARSRASVGALAVFEQNLSLNRYYEEAGEALGALVIPVGRAWERVLRDPSRSLHVADGSHPSPLGTYLAACVFYELLTGEAALGVGNGGLEIADKDATFLQTVTAETVRARVRPTLPLLGRWPFSDDLSGSDLIISDGISLGDVDGPSRARSATHFTGGFGAIPYFAGSRAAHITVSIYAHRNDWSEPTPHPSLPETLVARYAAYELSQFGTTLSATVRTSNNSDPAPILFDVSSLAPAWHHFALSYDGATYALWVDGVEVGQAPATGALSYSDSTVIPDFGRFNGIAVSGAPSGGGTVAIGMVSGFTGAMADLRIYNAALGAEAIEALANQ